MYDSLRTQHHVFSWLLQAKNTKLRIRVFTMGSRAVQEGNVRDIIFLIRKELTCSCRLSAADNSQESGRRNVSFISRPPNSFPKYISCLHVHDSYQLLADFSNMNSDVVLPLRKCLDTSRSSRRGDTTIRS